MELPQKGLTKEDIFKKLDKYKEDDLDWQSGKAFGYIFDPGQEILQFAKQVYNMFLSENALDFTVYPSLLSFENDLVSIMRKHLNGDENVVGNFTSGGTESIILAVKTARDYYRDKKPEIEEPEMILPTTAHAAFHKAAHYLNLKTVSVSVNPVTFKADIKEVEKSINKNTIFMMGSAPSYTQGVIDPIFELSEIARENDIWFHTDACMGGFLLPFFKKLGRDVVDFDFSCPGVNSISVDLHKYAYTPKGASLILHRNSEQRHFQLFAFADWLGYTMINPTIQSTKSGGSLAAAWAVLNHVGEEQYLDFAQKQIDIVREIKEGIEEIPELYMMAEPEMTLISFSSKEVSVFHIIDEMNLKGWYIQPSLSFDNIPASIHLSVTLSNAGHSDAFIKDLKKSVEKAKNLPPSELLSMFNQFMKDGGADDLLENLGPLLELAGIKDGRMPDRTAPVNEVLDAIPSEVRKKLLLEVTNTFFHPKS
ncbi:MAG: aminotransferase class V-fold PLP-dependent enzyme [Desulfobacteraceae bacterium]|nr:aminotransferase class V-fold PLP-dependent enzyme [Desulfobacteraceae bacterium]